MEKKAHPWLGATWPKFPFSRLSFLRSSQEGKLWSPSCWMKSGSTKVHAELGQVLCHRPSGPSQWPWTLCVLESKAWCSNAPVRPMLSWRTGLALQGSEMFPLHQMEWWLRSPWECEVLGRFVSSCLGPQGSESSSFDLNPLTGKCTEDWTEQMEETFPLPLFWSEGNRPWHAMGRINLNSCLHSGQAAGKMQGDLTAGP